MEINVPEEVEVKLKSDNKIDISGPNGEVSKELSYPGVNIKADNEEVMINHPDPRKKEKAVMGSFASHIRNAIEGVQEEFEYKLKIIYAHFPIDVTVEGGYVVIENFLGEAHPRKAEILDPARVEVDDQDEEIYVRGPDKDAVGQTASNIEKTTQIKGKDPRRFQDGIYITSRGD